MSVTRIDDVLEEVEIVIDTHFFNEFSKTKSSIFLKRVSASQNAIEMKLFKKTWRMMNCSPKTMKVIMEIQENLLCVGKEKNLSRRSEQSRDAGAARQDCSLTPIIS